MIGKNGRISYMESLLNSEVILYDSSSSIEKLKKFKTEKSTIITFDHQSHKTLTQNGIIHKISDDFLNEDDLKLIQDSSYSFAKWFDQESISKTLEYEGINLGELFYVEFHYFLIPFLKKFIETSKILDTYKNSKFIVSPTLHSIVNSFTKSVILLESNTEEPKTFLYDTIKFTFSLRGYPITLNLSRGNYLKIKKFTEKIIHVFFGSNNKSDFKNILLVEFDPVKYHKLFSALPKTELNVSIFNRRRPVIWNWQSFSIIKNSKCNIITNYALPNASEYNIKSKLLQVDQIVKELSRKDEFFNSFFSIAGFSFWNVIKETFIDLCKKRMKEAIPEILLTKLLLQKYEFNSILVWNENGFNEKIIIELGKKAKIPIILLQHGLYYDTPQSLQYNEFAGIMPNHSDLFFVWGKAFQNYSINSGVPMEKITIVGSPLYDELFEMKSSSKEDFILLATSSPVKNLVNDLTVKTMEDYENAIRRICQVVSEMNKKLVIKLHPFQEEVDITNLAREIDPRIVVIKDGSIIPLISSCQILVTIDLSTTILEAQILHKPVIAVLVKNYGMGNPEVFKSNSCVYIKDDYFEDVLKKMLGDNNFRQEVIENGDKFVNYYLSYHGIATRNLLEHLSK